MSESADIGYYIASIPGIHSDIGKELKWPQPVQCNGTPDGDGVRLVACSNPDGETVAKVPKSGAVRSLPNDSEKSAASRI